jgi:hypothetical protein
MHRTSSRRISVPTADRYEHGTVYSSTSALGTFRSLSRRSGCTHGSHFLRTITSRVGLPSQRDIRSAKARDLVPAYMIRNSGRLPIEKGEFGAAMQGFSFVFLLAKGFAYLPYRPR